MTAITPVEVIDAYEAAVAGLATQLDKLRAENTALRGQLATAQSQRDDAMAQLTYYRAAEW
jgi:ribosomal protein L29